MKYLVERVFPEVYQTDEYFSEVSRNWPYTENQPDTSHQIRQYRYHEDGTGEFRAVVIGTRVWINVADLSRRTGIEERVILRMAGSSRTAKVSNLEIRDADEPSGVSSFVTYDAACAFLNALGCGYFNAAHLDQWVSNVLLTPKAQLESGRCVRASSLHRVLRNDSEFTVWVADIRRNHPTLLRHLDTLTNLEAGDDFEIPLTEAFAIARGKREYPGNLCRTLIRNGGFFHQGPLKEPMDATFERLKGLMPNQCGLVSARAVHAFLGVSCTFEDWVRQLKPCCIPYEFNTMIDHEIMSIDLAYRSGLQDCLLSIIEG